MTLFSSGEFTLDLAGGSDEKPYSNNNIHPPGTDR